MSCRQDPHTVCGDDVLNVAGDDNLGDWEVSANHDGVASSCFTEGMSSTLTGTDFPLDDPLTVCGDHVLNVAGDSESPSEMGVDRA